METKEEQEPKTTATNSKKRSALTESFSGIFKCQFCKLRSPTINYFGCDCLVICDTCYAQILKIKSGVCACANCKERSLNLELQKQNHHHNDLSSSKLTFTLEE